LGLAAKTGQVIEKKKSIVDHVGRGLLPRKEKTEGKKWRLQHAKKEETRARVSSDRKNSKKRCYLLLCSYHNPGKKGKQEKEKSVRKLN